ncbi:hypothetical protein PR048_003713 [Dryococelus australis]|uniref:Uncharacterized protein n=1 Tax=Dryococelus australis TaxID=614101 RepID=A0ABQ9INT1_9NEOP|nr:hypothetical protein PR048_003713 [Dryococelus australis]
MEQQALGMQEREKQEIPEKTYRPEASSGTIPAHAIIQERPRRESNLVRLGGRRVRVTAAPNASETASSEVRIRLEANTCCKVLLLATAADLPATTSTMVEEDPTATGNQGQKFFNSKNLTACRHHMFCCASVYFSSSPFFPRPKSKTNKQSTLSVVYGLHTSSVYNPFTVTPKFPEALLESGMDPVGTRSRSEGAIRATLTRTPSASSLLRAVRYPPPHVDGAPAHLTLAVREFLSVTFGYLRIGRGGPVPRSADPTEMDFYLWGYMKWLVYETPVDSFMSFIVQAPQNVITATEDSRLSRCRLCIREGGQHLKQFIELCDQLLYGGSLQTFTVSLQMLLAGIFAAGHSSLCTNVIRVHDENTANQFESVALSDDGALDARGSIALIAPTLLSLKQHSSTSRSGLYGGRDTTDITTATRTGRLSFRCHKGGRSERQVSGVRWPDLLWFQPQGRLQYLSLRRLVATESQQKPVIIRTANHTRMVRCPVSMDSGSSTFILDNRRGRPENKHDAKCQSAAVSTFLGLNEEDSRLNFTVLYVPEPTSFSHWLLRRCQATPFRNEPHVIVAHHCNVFNDWCSVTQGVPDAVWSNDRRITKDLSVPHVPSSRTTGEDVPKTNTKNIQQSVFVISVECGCDNDLDFDLNGGDVRFERYPLLLRKSWHRPKSQINLKPSMGNQSCHLCESSRESTTLKRGQCWQGAEGGVEGMTTGGNSRQLGKIDHFLPAGYHSPTSHTHIARCRRDTR